MGGSGFGSATTTTAGVFNTGGETNDQAKPMSTGAGKYKHSIAGGIPRPKKTPKNTIFFLVLPTTFVLRTIQYK